MQNLQNLKVWLRNTRNTHHKWMARFLEKRGWVVFYLEDEHRKCSNDLCWLKLYQQEK